LVIGDWGLVIGQKQVKSMPKGRSEGLKAKSKKKEFFLLPFYFLLFTSPVPLQECPLTTNH
jgi:hypothetical protein